MKYLDYHVDDVEIELGEDKCIIDYASSLVVETYGEQIIILIDLPICSSELNNILAKNMPMDITTSSPVMDCNDVFIEKIYGYIPDMKLMYASKKKDSYNRKLSQMLVFSNEDNMENIKFTIESFKHSKLLDEIYKGSKSNNQTITVKSDISSSNKKDFYKLIPNKGKSDVKLEFLNECINDRQAWRSIKNICEKYDLYFDICIVEQCLAKYGGVISDKIISEYMKTISSCVQYRDLKYKDSSF